MIQERSVEIVDVVTLIRRVLDQFSPEGPEIISAQRQLDEDARMSRTPRSIVERFVIEWQQAQDRHALTWQLIDKTMLALAMDRTGASEILLDILCPSEP